MPNILALTPLFSAVSKSLLSLALTVAMVSFSLAQEVYDPIEPVNRAIFDFNDTIDEYVLEPVAKGYDEVLPGQVKTGVSNFFENIRYPIYLVSDVLQLKFSQAGRHTGRFLMNTVGGFAGIIDVAKACNCGLEKHEEDIGTAMGYWGVPPGPYLVIPFLGPSNVRDGIGRFGSAALTPTYYINDWGIIVGATALNVVDERRKLIDAVDAAKEGSLDYYLFVRSSYNQVRLNLIYDNDPPPELLGTGEESESAPAAEETK